MTDQQRADSMGCAGHPQIKTPNMDKLANEGTRFANATTVSPICMPARASFINGLYPHNHNMWTNEGEMPAKDETFFHFLQKEGYYTAHVGKSHYYEHKEEHMRNKEDYMHARGLDYVHETTGPWATTNTESYMTDDWKKKNLLDLFKKDYAERRKNPFLAKPSPLPVDDFIDSYIGRKACEFTENFDDSKPVCLFVGFGGPHDPWDAPGEYAKMYDPAKTPPAFPVPKDNAKLPEYVRQKHDFIAIPNITLENIQKIRANYYGKISLIDNWIGKILSSFEKRKLLDNLLVILWSDHGEMLGDHGRIHKQVFHESSIRVPLILHWPGHIPAGATSDALVEIIDVFPTILESANIKQSKRCLGKSLWPVLKNPKQEFRQDALSEIWFGESRNMMIRTTQYKYAVDDKARGFMLYDIIKDPGEQHNLIGQEDKLEAEMKERLFKRLLNAQYTM